MLRYIVGRIGQSLLLLFLVSIIGYFVLLLAPGGPMSQFALTPGISKQDLDRIAEQMGLNRPIIVQYADWLWHLLQGDWGASFRDNRPVLTVILDHLPATLLLMGTAAAIAMTLGVCIGILGAVRRYSIFDYVATVGAMIALSVPTFWFGLIAIYVFSLNLGWFPAGNMYTIGSGSVG
ncbi:MAG: ABC transporter permease, partial [Mesorhizobium sp.]